MTAWLGPLPLSNYASGRSGHTIDFIVLHHSEGSVASVDAHFHNPASGVSAHYMVSLDGQTVQWVLDSDTAYHAGNLTANFTSVGVENEELGDDAFTDEQYASLAALVRRLCLEHGVPIQRGSWSSQTNGVIAHRDVTPTACPGLLDIDRVIREAQEEAVTPEQMQELKDFIAAQTNVVVQATIAIELRSMRGANPATPGNDGPIQTGEHIFPPHAK